jgi:peptidyl-prolyl cis-trans isomerase C
MTSAALLRSVPLAALLLAAPALAQETAEAPEAGAPAPAAPALTAPSRDTVVATVNGVDITFGEVIVAAAQLPPQYRQLPAEILLGGVIDQLVQQELLAQSVAEPPARVAIALAVERRNLLTGEAVAAIVDEAVTDEALQALYDETVAAGAPVTEYDAAHILVATEAEALAVLDRLAAGEDFAAVAAEVSTDTGSGAMGGALGWFTGEMMVPEFTAAVEALVGQPAGSLSPPVQSQFGWHVVRLNATRERPLPSLEEMRAELEGQLRQQAVEARLADLAAAAAITRLDPATLDPAALGDLSLLED